MRSIAIIAVIGSLFLVSCKPDKQKQLDTLIQKRDHLTEKINALKADIEAKTDTLKKEKLIVVKTEPVKPSSFKHFIEVQGTVESDNNIFVPSQAMGLVTKIYVKEGDKVSKGQLLAETDASILEKSIQQVVNGYSLAKDVYERQARLWEKKIGSEIQYLQAKNNKENLEKQLEALREQYKLTKLYAPINGTVDDVMLKEGESAVGGGIRVIQLSKLKISAPVSESYIADIEKGDSVTVSFPALDTKLNEAISSVSKFIDAGNRTFNIEIMINDENTGIMPNMIGIVKVNDYFNPGVVVIPNNLVQKNEKENFVFVAVKKDGKYMAQKRNVKTGMDYNNRIEILDGLKTGEEIITTGYQNLKDNDLIQM